MCLVLIGWRAHPDYRLIVAANRDEYYTRPTESLRWWPEVPGLVAGRDLGGGKELPGAWLGLIPGQHRFATVTNVRGQENRVDTRSRGALLLDFLRGDAAPEKFVRSVTGTPDEYNGYNLLVSDLETLWWHSNRSVLAPRELLPGLYGLSNGALLASAQPDDDPTIHTDTGATAWPKVRDGLRDLRAVIATAPGVVDGYLEVLSDRGVAPDDELPDTGLPRLYERAASARFVANTLHGTRASTVLIVREDGEFTFTEHSFGLLGRRRGEQSHTGRLTVPA
jgi:uncharacterized protein with NRDE domain